MMRILGVVLLSALVSGVAFAEGRVDINSAGAEQLAAMLEGVGESRAQAIVEYREDNGDFARIEDLTEVSGIGRVTLENNRELLTVGD